jgi:hypothetical protein
MLVIESRIIFMRIAKTLCLLVALLGCASTSFAQITISGVADKTTYNNTVTLTVGTQAGYDYNATLNWQPIAVGTPVVVNKPDFYELRVDATNQVGGAVTSLYRRFIVLDTTRAGTEWGLPPHVPFPVIQSSPSEFTGARLRVLTPASFPTGYEIPVVAWVVDEDNHAVRANGVLAASGQNSIQLKRGVGSGFLASNQVPGVLNYQPSVGGVTTNKPITLESGTVWSNVSGTLSGVTTWPAQSRIRVTGHLSVPAGSSLTIGAGAVVLLNSGVNITNNGAITINGTVDEPVIFTPNSRAQPWGGFFMRTATGSMNGTGVIFVASGADPSGGAGHRSEQCLFLVDSTPTISLTDSAAIYLAGQMGHAYAGGTFNFNRFLLQRATTGGEYTGANWTVNDSAFIEFPDDTANFVDGDNDALYFVSGSHVFTNTLFGWTKDDGIDSGGSGYGPLTYQSCWFEGTFHEGNSLSGYKNVLTRGTVYFDCGQGIEGGYDAPTSRVEHCFFTMNKSGLRHGDNYATFSQYNGTMTGTNNISIYNHRDLFGFNWDNSNSGGWTNNYERFFASNNFVSALDTNYPNNTLWNPATDGWRLAAVGGVPRVGVGFGVRSSSLSQFPDGVPVGLSRHCTNEVTVDYEIDGTDGTHVTGTLVYPAGLTRRYIPAPTNVNGVLRIALVNPVNADVTGQGSLLFQNLPPSGGGSTVVLMPLASNWRYLDNGTEQGAAWRAPGFDDSSWSNGVARLGFGTDALPVVTTIRRFVQTNGVDTTRQVTNYYFRRSFVITNLAAFETVQFRYQRDDACVVYLNGVQLFTNNMGLPPYTANTFSSSTISGATALNTYWTNTVPATNFLTGTNWLAVEVHQASATSSDIAWNLEVVGLPAPTPPRVNLVHFGNEAILYWNDPTFGLEEADLVTGPWRPSNPTNSPSASTISSNRFFRLKK